MDERGFLRLLLDEAPADAFEEVVRAAQAAGDPGTTARVREAAVMALQLRATLEDRRRREGELAALSETAGDLIAIRDVHRVLQAIVRRARRLLQADTAYLTLIDHARGDTSMQVTDGTVGEAFRTLRLPFGVGLGGLVAQTAQPSFTPDYLNDPRFHHTAAIDGAVAAERIQAIVGVPLVVGDRVLGVLFAADRSERHHTPGQVSLLSSLAAHAAVAIENARLFQEARQAVTELNVANDMVRSHSAAVERAAAVHDRLTDVILRGGDVTQLAAVVADVLAASLTIIDDHGGLLAYVGRDPCPAPELLDAALDQVRRSARTQRVVAADGAAQPALWATPVLAANECLGALLLQGAGDLAGPDLRTFERSAVVTALQLLTQRSIAEAENRARGELLEDLLSHGPQDAARLRRRARMLGVDLDRAHAVVVASAADRRALAGAAAALVGREGGLVAERGGTMVVLLPVASSDQAAAAARAQLGPDTTAGVAGPADTPAAIAGAYQDADRTRRALLALGREGRVAAVGDLGVYALLLNRAGSAELAVFEQRVLGRVARYDAERGSELVATLEAYFAAGGNLTRAARALHVHVNTLYQRLDRVGRLLGEGWQQPAAALDLHLALTLRRLRQELGAGNGAPDPGAASDGPRQRDVAEASTGTPSI